VSIKRVLIDQIKKHTRLFIYLRNFVKTRTIFNKSLSNQNSIFIESRGHINMLKNGYNSDFFWATNSDFPLTRIVYNYLNNHEKIILEKNDIFATNGHTKYFPIKNNLKYKKKS
jgi:hypothetical protein